MTNHVSATTGCLLVGECVDEAECPADKDGTLFTSYDLSQ